MGSALSTSSCPPEAICRSGGEGENTTGNRPSARPQQAANMWCRAEDIRARSVGWAALPSANSVTPVMSLRLSGGLCVDTGSRCFPYRTVVSRWPFPFPAQMQALRRVALLASARPGARGKSTTWDAARALIQDSPVAAFTKSYCPGCRDLMGERAQTCGTVPWAPTSTPGHQSGSTTRT